MGEKKNKRSPQQTSSTSLSLWRILLWVLLITVVISFFTDAGNRDGISISYSTFKNQLSNKNISQVTFNGNRLSGEFRSPYSPGTDNQQQDTTYLHFNTVIPPLDDNNLLDVLEDQGVTIEAEPTDSGSMWWFIIISFLPFILLFGLLYYSAKRMGSQGGMGGQGIFNVGKSKAIKFRKNGESVQFNDVAGLENAKQNLSEIVAYLKNPKKFTNLGAEVPKGILLMGPPGTGKTLLAKAVAGEAGIPFYSASGSEFIEMFVGVGASRVRDLFNSAKQEAPSIIFIDEIDSIGRTRGAGVGGGHDEREQTLNQILNEMDGFQPHEAVVVLAATNRPDVLDPALTRPGRFDREIILELPQKQARLKILKIHTRKVPLADNVDLENISARTVGFSGAVLKNLVNEAALLAGRKNKKIVDREDFDEALDKIRLGMEHEEKINEEEKRLVAYHESGHALIAKLLPNTDPLQKVTIIPRGRSLGATEQTPEIDRHNLSRSYILDHIAVRLGGRAAEIAIFNEMTNGSASDLKQATEIARKMVCQWGMSERIGPMTVNQGEDHVFLGREITQNKNYSDYTAKLIDEEVRTIISREEQRVRDILTKNKNALDALAKALIEHESLNNEDVEKILAEQKIQT